MPHRGIHAPRFHAVPYTGRNDFLYWSLPFLGRLEKSGTARGQFRTHSGDARRLEARRVLIL